jgi:hypothetical protein
LKELSRLHNSDEYEAELGVVSQVLAYFEISSRRIIDVMPMIFETVFVRNFSQEIRKVLISELKLVGDFGLENCIKYAKDEVGIEIRNDLAEAKEILSRAADFLNQIL